MIRVASPLSLLIPNASATGRLMKSFKKLGVAQLESESTNGLGLGI